MRVGTARSIWAGFLALSLLAPAARAEQPVGSVAGLVKDARTGKPLAGVSVVASSPALASPITEITDAAGAYRIAALPPGEYRITYYYSDAHVARAGITVAAGRA